MELLLVLQVGRITSANSGSGGAPQYPSRRERGFESAASPAVWPPSKVSNTYAGLNVGKSFNVCTLKDA